MLTNKFILLGVSGSIAAYKSLSLCRLLKKLGAKVQVLMTPSATSFVGPLSFSTLSQNEVYIDFSNENNTWNQHVDLGIKADAMIIAPASATTIAKMAHGIADNMLLATYLSAKCPVFIAPAMDLDMWKHPSTQNNIDLLKKYGNIIWEPNHGELASGLVGQGRMIEPEEIVLNLQNNLEKKKILSGKKILVNAGPTYEPIDPVRYIGNHASGLMGIALADVCYELGADVHLVLGPTSLQPKYNFKITRVTTSDEMHKTCTDLFDQIDVAICAAAIADFKPIDIAKNKIKKDESTLQLSLTKTKDTLASLGKLKKDNQVLVGFALETNDVETYAIKKIKSKNLDLIVANSPSHETGFGTTTNQAVLIDKNQNKTEIPLMDKYAMAEIIVKKIITLLPKN